MYKIFLLLFFLNLNSHTIEINQTSNIACLDESDSYLKIIGDFNEYYSHRYEYAFAVLLNLTINISNFYALSSFFFLKEEYKKGCFITMEFLNLLFCFFYNYSNSFLIKFKLCFEVLFSSFNIFNLYKENVELKYVYFSFASIFMCICTEFYVLDSLYRHNTLMKRVENIKKFPIKIKKKLQKEFLAKIDCKLIDSDNSFKCFNEIQEVYLIYSILLTIFVGKSYTIYSFKYLEFDHDFDEMFLWLLTSYYYGLDRYWIYNSKKIDKSLFMDIK